MNVNSILIFFIYIEIGGVNNAGCNSASDFNAYNKTKQVILKILKYFLFHN